MVTITLTPELERVITERAIQEDTTPELLALNKLNEQFLLSLQTSSAPPSDKTSRRSIIDVLAEAPGHLAFHSAEEVDAYIREERDAWER